MDSRACLRESTCDWAHCEWLRPMADSGTLAVTVMGEDYFPPAVRRSGAFTAMFNTEIVAMQGQGVCDNVKDSMLWACHALKKIVDSGVVTPDGLDALITKRMIRTSYSYVGVGAAIVAGRMITAANAMMSLGINAKEWQGGNTNPEPIFPCWWGWCPQTIPTPTCSKSPGMLSHHDVGKDGAVPRGWTRRPAPVPCAL